MGCLPVVGVFSVWGGRPVRFFYPVSPREPKDWAAVRSCLLVEVPPSVWLGLPFLCLFLAKMKVDVRNGSPVYPHEYVFASM